MVSPLQPERAETGTHSVARRLWQRLETLHAVTYFAPESHAAASASGLKGFWMGYFGFRAAPMGAVDSGVVIATFANFAPRMVERSIPDAWSFADPGDLVDARSEAARSALRRVAPSVDAVAAAAINTLEQIVAAAEPLGRPLFAANEALAASDDVVARLWQLATTLREHRGDAHVSALAAAELDGCEAHLLHAAEHGTPDEVLQPNRGWTDSEWAGALERLRRRGLVDHARRLTAEGAACRAVVEAATDRAAAQPVLAAVGSAEAERLIELLDEPAREVAASGVLPYPNPMGLPAFD